MKITLKNDWLGHKAGYEMVVNEVTGLTLIERGIAKAFVADPPSGYVTCTRCGAFIKMKNKESEPKPEPEPTVPESEEPEAVKPSVSALDELLNEG